MADEDAHSRDAYKRAYEFLDQEIGRLAIKLDLILVRPDDTDIYGQWKGERPSRHLRGLPSYLFPTLPHAAGHFAVDEDCEVVCISSISAKTFWSYVAETMSIEAEDMPRAGQNFLRIPLPAAPSCIDSGLVRNVQLKLSYCRRPPDFDPQLSHSYLIPKDSTNDNIVLAKVYDQQSLSIKRQHGFQYGEKINMDKLAFETAFTLYQDWARACGILSTRLRLMSVECLLQIFTTCYESVRQGSTDGDQSRAVDVLNRVFQHANPEASFSKDLASVLTSSGRNLADDISSEGKHMIHRAFALSRVQQPPVDVPQTTLSTYGTRTFAQQHTLFIVVRVSCWVPKKYAEVSATMPQVLLTLQRHVRAYHYSGLIWPYPTPWSGGDGEALNEEFHLAVEHVGQGPKGGSEKVDEDAVAESLDTFSSKLQYDTSSCFIEFSTCNQDGFLASRSPDVGCHTRSHSPQTSTSKVPTRQGAGFRTAKSAMSRLRWDPAHQSKDYEIGYVDRFEDELIWKLLEKWEKMTEEEEFIPEHRIRQIRRKEDHVVVWDRERRIDHTDEV